MSSKFKVRIRCTQEVVYDQIIEMTRAEFDELTALDDRTLESGTLSPLGDWLDLSDVSDGGNFDNIEIKKYVPKKAKT